MISPSRAIDDVSSLCRTCALCCDGTLFAYVTVSAAEAEALRARDVALAERKDGTFRLPQPCRALERRSCTVYAERPAPCRSYACLLAKALEERELGLDEALAIVEGAHQRLARLRAALAMVGDTSPVPAVRASLRGEGPAPSDQATRLWQDAREYLRRHFTGRHGMS